MSRRSRIDLFIFVGIVGFFLFLYCYSNAVLEMHTDRYTPAFIISTGILSYLYCFYLFYRYLNDGRKKILSSMGACLGPAILFWLLITFNYIKAPMLAGYWRNAPRHATLQLLDVSQRRHKGSFNGGRVKTVLDQDTVTLDCSRTLYFALKDLRNIDADFGMSADGRNWYISKVYLDQGDYSAARSAYWHDWRQRRLPWLIIVALLICGGLLVALLEKMGIVRLPAAKAQRWATEKPPDRKVSTQILLFFVLTFLGLLLYILYQVVTHH